MNFNRRKGSLHSFRDYNALHSDKPDQLLLSLMQVWNKGGSDGPRLYWDNNTGQDQ